MSVQRFFPVAAVLMLVGCTHVQPTPYVGGLTYPQVLARLGPDVEDDRAYSVAVAADSALRPDPRLFPREQPKDGSIVIRQVEFRRSNDYPIYVYFRKQLGRWIAYGMQDPTQYYKARHVSPKGL